MGLLGILPVSATMAFARVFSIFQKLPKQHKKGVTTLSPQCYLFAHSLSLSTFYNAVVRTQDLPYVSFTAERQTALLFYEICSSNVLTIEPN